MRLTLLSDLRVGAGRDETVVNAPRDVVAAINDDVDPDFVAVLEDLIQHGPDAGVDVGRNLVFRNSARAEFANARGLVGEEQ